MNKNLKKIFPFISIYWARHSWATIAAELDTPDSVIDMAMGHKIQGMASVYIRRNLNKVSEANRKVIDYLFEKQ
jgi:integrase